MKVILSKKLIALSVFINSVEISQIKMIYLKVLGGKQIQQSKQIHREQQIKRNIINNQNEMNKIDTTETKTSQRIKVKDQLFEMLSRIYKTKQNNQRNDPN